MSRSSLGPGAASRIVGITTEQAIQIVSSTAKNARDPDNLHPWIPIDTVVEGGNYTPGEPNVIYDSDPQLLTGYSHVFKMWYSIVVDGIGGCIGYRESATAERDSWVEWPTGWLFGTYFRAGHVTRYRGVYYMTALCTYGPDAGKLNLMSSDDGVSGWAKVSTVVVPLADSYKTAINNSSMLIEEGKWTCWFSTVNAAGKYVVCVARSTDDGATWTEDAANPVLSTMPRGPNAGGSVCGPFAQKIGRTYYVWVHSSPVGAAAPTDIQRVETLDGTTYTQAIEGFTLPRYSPSNRPHVEGVKGQMADVTMCEVRGKTYAFVVGLSDSAYESHIDLFVANKTIAELVATGEGIVVPAKPDMMTNGSAEKPGGYGEWGAAGGWVDQNGTGGVTRTTAAGEFRSGTGKKAGFKITAGASRADATIQTIWEAIPGKTYVLRGWHRGDGSNGGRVDVLDSAMESLLNPATVQQLTKSTAFAEFAVPFVAPADGVVLVCLKCPDVEGGVAYFDDLTMREIPEVGDTPKPDLQGIATAARAENKEASLTLTDGPSTSTGDLPFMVPANRGLKVQVELAASTNTWVKLRLNKARVAPVTGHMHGFIDETAHPDVVLCGYAGATGCKATIQISAANASGVRDVFGTYGGSGVAGVYWGSIAVGTITHVGGDSDDALSIANGTRINCVASNGE